MCACFLVIARIMPSTVRETSSPLTLNWLRHTENGRRRYKIPENGGVTAAGGNYTVIEKKNNFSLSHC